jgi:tetratricopeptide (TPR) repeat protein
MKRLLPAGFLIFFILAPGSLSGETTRESIRAFLHRGVERGLQLDEKASEAEIKKAVELDRENPMGYAFLAMSHLFFFETGFEEKEKKKKEELLLQAVADALARAERKIEKDPQDADAYFSGAIAKMVKNRREIIRKNYFRAFREAQNVWDYLEKVRELDPANHDVYYPMGVLHYHLAQLSGVTRWITSLFITAGDREKGLQEFTLASAKGYLLRDLAQSSLVSAYSGYEKQPARALPLAKGLKAKYPTNYNFSFALANILSDLGQTENALSIAREIETGIKSITPPYRPELWPRHQQLLGKIHFDQGQYEKAVEYFKLALKDSAPYNARVRALALVRLGMIHDIRQERKMAEEYYQKALEIEGAEGLAQRDAKEYLGSPYVPPKRK